MDEGQRTEARVFKSKSRKRFLTAEWRSLLMINYEIAPAILMPYLPRGVELDALNGRTFASLVGFLFLNTRVLGATIPFHRNFEEVNLRFYVRRKAPEGWRRGVVFIKEIVPRRAIAAVARGAYGEKYVSMPMRHRVELVQTGGSVEYAWRLSGRWNRMCAQAHGEALFAMPDSEEEFITEHYWGYSSRRDGGTSEYQVEHPRWRVWQARGIDVDCNFHLLYGPQFQESLSSQPSSAFIADGSEVVVYQGQSLV
jgi:uncharacterized protein YqjF (DUF2071 family)